MMVQYFPILQLPVERQLEIIDHLYELSIAAGYPSEGELPLNISPTLDSLLTSPHPHPRQEWRPNHHRFRFLRFGVRG
jgi:hypothetical protein